MSIDKYHLNLGSEYRVASELLFRGLFATVTYGNKKGADLYVIGNNRQAAVVEVKASQKNRFVTGLFQKYRRPDEPHPDFWVLHHVGLKAGDWSHRFFVLSHAEIVPVQMATNAPGLDLSYEEVALRSAKGVDNVSLKSVEVFENAWGKILDHCGGPVPS